MDCSEVVRALVEEEESLTRLRRAETHEHVINCESCKELVRVLDPPVDAERPSPVMLRRLEQSLAVDLQPVRPLWPRHYFLAAFAGIFVSIVAIGLLFMGAPAINAMTRVQAGPILFTLAASAGALSYSLVRQMVPGSRHRLSPRLLPPGIALLLLLVMAGLFEFQDESDFLKHGLVCLVAGIPFALITGLPFWLLLRRGAILSPRATGAATGLLAGLAGTSVLEFHCLNLDAWHILAWHLGVAVLSAMVGLILGLAGEVTSRHA